MTNTQSPAPGVAAEVEAALKKAFNLGQTYWQQADSDYESQHRKSDETRRKFDKLVEETICTVLASRTPAPGMAGGVGDEPQEETLCDCGQPWGTPHHCAYQNGHDIYANPSVIAPHPSPAPQAAGAAFDDGWRLCAKWAKRDDLLADMDSPAFKDAKVICLAAIEAGRAGS